MSRPGYMKLLPYHKQRSNLRVLAPPHRDLRMAKPFLYECRPKQTCLAHSRNDRTTTNRNTSPYACMGIDVPQILSILHNELPKEYDADW